MAKNSLLIIGIAVVSLAAGVFSARWLVSEDTSLPSTSKDIGVPTTRPEFELPDLKGTLRHIREWDGKVILLNFWATWCPPCRKEIPAFIALREQLADQPFEVIGVAIDEAEPVQDFIDGLGAEYPILLAELDGIEIMRRYGNHLGVLPYTVVIDAGGDIATVFRREVHTEDLIQSVYPLLGIPTPDPSKIDPQ